MSESLADKDPSDLVTLNFQIIFHKAESVVAPDGSVHGILAHCLQPEYHTTIVLKPFAPDGSDTPIVDQRHAYVRKATDDRALLGIAQTLFDAQLARTASVPHRPRHPPPRTPTVQC